MCWSLEVRSFWFFENSGLGRPEKNIRFINGEGGVERGAVNLRSAAEPWSGLERKGRGSEHGAGLGSAAGGAAQAGLTEGAERSSRLRHETNVEWCKDQPKAAPRIGGFAYCHP